LLEPVPVTSTAVFLVITNGFLEGCGGETRLCLKLSIIAQFSCNNAFYVYPRDENIERNKLERIMAVLVVTKPGPQLFSGGGCP